MRAFERNLSIVLSLFVAQACAPGEGGVDSDVSNDSSAALGEAERTGVLEVANSLSITELDDAVRLDHRAAVGIVARRDEDGDFRSLEDLDAVPYVGATALSLLRDYATEHGFVAGEEPEDACLIISEYVEGTGSNNKAVEIWNCGDHPVRLKSRSLCLVRNGDHGCSTTRKFSDVDLGAGKTWVVCRTLGGTFNDPLQSLRDRCDEEMPGVVAMSGDDRIAILDTDGSVLDAFGRLASRPASEIWADVVLRRCDLNPYRGTGAFSIEGRFTTHSRNTHAGLGVAPEDGCD